MLGARSRAPRDFASDGDAATRLSDTGAFSYLADTAVNAHLCAPRSRCASVQLTPADWCAWPRMRPRCRWLHNRGPRAPLVTVAISRPRPRLYALSSPPIAPLSRSRASTPASYLHLLPVGPASLVPRQRRVVSRRGTGVGVGGEIFAHGIYRSPRTANTCRWLCCIEIDARWVKFQESRPCASASGGDLLSRYAERVP